MRSSRASPLLSTSSSSSTVLHINTHQPPTVSSSSSLTVKSTKRPLTAADVPIEIWSRVFSFLGPSASSAGAPFKFSQVCRRWNDIANDPHAKASFFIRGYGRPLALYHAFKSHRLSLSVEVAALLRKRGAALPRFLVQYVDKEYHRTDRGQKAVSVPLYVFFVQEGFKAYGKDADFKEDDVSRFERLAYAGQTAAATNTPLTEGLEAMNVLLDEYAFVPVKGLGSPMDESVFLISQLDISLIPKLVANGLNLDSVNDQVLERVLWRADITDEILQPYLKHGFKLSPSAIRKGLQMARPATVEVLKKHIDSALLASCASETVVDMMGPIVGRGWSWAPERMDYIINTFGVSEEAIARAIFTHPDSARLPNGSRPEFPATRCYMKANPCPVWRWVLQRYGPHHHFTQACFDDAISRAAADRDLHLLHDEFLESGVQFFPRHVKILACRLLHRDMTANALHLLQALREQVTDSRDAGLLADSERKEWVQALRDEVVDNDEWKHRMRTTQLEGGARGGAYRITRPPHDAIAFLDEANKFYEEMLVPIPTIATVVLRNASMRRPSPPTRSPSMKSWVKRMGTWWKEQVDRGVWGAIENGV
ncbi:uncharacterized protein EV422DRAFT_565739 [Fimicolochytrium jonesii]|uniref:uncharacterized protein n=1 Tax=Fimicolochytrium jonesii TaxID=1396493 RepID=UPI0022FE007B|nr:uncharacterized protein EV422DRAFT_565739 [Fimicolochytrium jonesii]KAI8822882.1 hypothetical protein EV422DRAFT_565739 [Fimicolochytrium jonesii]